MQLPNTPSFDLTGKRALISGASRGIGLACAAAMARAGCHVTLVARSAETLKDAQKMLLQENGNAAIWAVDITDCESVAKGLEERPVYDILINSAGVSRHKLALDTSPDDFDTVMGVNVRATYFMTTNVVKRMRDAGIAGSVISISSQMGHVGGTERTVYCASKHALEGMTKAMAIEWGQYGIRVNTVCPTFIQTPLTQSTLDDPDKLSWIMSKIQLGRLAEVEDVMGAVLFLASDAAAMVTGTALKVDGGWTAG